MARYIDADLFKKNKNPVWYQPDDNSRYCGLYANKDIENMIDAQPTADVQEVKHGHWKYHIQKAPPITYEWYECSVCNKTKKSGTRTLPPYCENCGAKMDEEVE